MKVKKLNVYSISKEFINMWVARNGENEFIKDIDYLADLDNVEFGSVRKRQTWNRVKNRVKRENTMPNTYEFRFKNSLLNTNTSEEHPIARYKQIVTDMRATLKWSQWDFYNNETLSDVTRSLWKGSVEVFMLW